MLEGKQERRAYVLRLWPSESEGKRVWRAMLQNPFSAEQHVFASLQALCAFLEEQTTGSAPTPAGGRSADKEGGEIDTRGEESENDKAF
ncbi:MAG: hypothetical protein JXA74_00530 [Anaerolineae bacterium]|nr:hypothetical protein [Anaerolineae bacterium]